MTPFKAPSKVKFVDGLPKSLVGKVLKKELRKLI
jgi:acyl-coenzyme A synthetase/AMP-(fatty) acid ligase